MSAEIFYCPFCRRDCPEGGRAIDGFATARACAVCAEMLRLAVENSVRRRHRQNVLAATQRNSARRGVAVFAVAFFFVFLGLLCLSIE